MDMSFWQSHLGPVNHAFKSIVNLDTYITCKIHAMMYYKIHVKYVKYSKIFLQTDEATTPWEN